MYHLPTLLFQSVPQSAFSMDQSCQLPHLSVLHRISQITDRSLASLEQKVGEGTGNWNWVWEKQSEKKKREEKGLGREGEKKMEGAIRGIHFSAQISETESLIGSSVLRNSQIYFPSSSILLQNVTFPFFVFLCDPTATKGFPQRPKGLGCKVHVLHIKSKFFCFFYFLCFLFF